MTKKAKLIIDKKTYEFPIVVGSESEKAIDISSFRKDTSYITLDPGFANTGSCLSAITYINGEKGVLRYRGIPVEELAKKSSFISVAYLLIYGHLPNKKELDKFSHLFTYHSMIHEDMKNFFDGYPSSAHPMAILSNMVCALSAYYPELVKPDPTTEDIDTICVELLSKVRTICALSYKKSIGQPIVYPRSDLKYVANFLHMMFSTPSHEYKITHEVVNALETLLIVHADHGQNCSTSTARLVGSSKANLFAAVSAAICALWGPLHGGANQKVVEMLQRIQNEGGSVKKYIEKAKDSKTNYKLMGFGHRVYKNLDPRAKIIKNKTHALMKKMGIKDPLLDIAIKLEKTALKDDYFIKRKLYPNVDFYSGLIYRAIGIPTNMFTVMFAIGRLPGWIAHWKEMREDGNAKIGRPRQIYIGKRKRNFVPMAQRPL